MEMVDRQFAKSLESDLIFIAADRLGLKKLLCFRLLSITKKPASQPLKYLLILIFLFLVCFQSFTEKKSFCS